MPLRSAPSLPVSSWLLAILLLLHFGAPAHATLVADWKADTYVSGAWSDTAATTPIPATPSATPVVVANAFGSHKGIDCGGSRYFTVPANRNPIGGKTSFTLAAVFRATAAGTTGANWYQASGLIGGEEGGVVNDFGLGWTGDSGGAVRGGAGFAGNADRTVSSGTQSVNVTHAAVLTYNGSTGVVTLFVDGQQVATATGTANAARDTATFGLGAMSTATTAFQPFPGLIAELQMYDTAENGATLSSSLLATYSPPQYITSFTSNKATAYEGDAIQLSWALSAAPTSVTITQGASTIFTGTSASGSTSTIIPSLAGTAQNITYLLTTVTNGVTNTAQVVVAADPGIPTATPQSGLTTLATTPLPINLSATDPNAGTLAYTITSPPLHGTLTGTGATRTYTAAAGYYGPDTFAFKVNDGTYSSNIASVSLTVTAPPTAPSSIALSTTQIPNTKSSGSWIADLSSADVNTNEAHTYTLVNGTGSTDNARFSISGHQLLAAQSMAVPVGTQYAIRVLSTDAQSLTVEQTFVLTVIAPTPGVVINEVLYNGLDNTVLDDFIELYNSGPAAVNLTGWRFSNAIDYTFPANTTIAPGGYLVVAENPSVIQAKFGKSALGPYTGSLSTDGETIRLRDASDAIVCEVDYKVGFPWPVAAGGDGTSMELINPSLDPSLGSSWRSATIPSATATTDVASPGAHNLKFAPNAAPNIRQVAHNPQTPPANTAVTVTARVTDPDGVASVQLLYQIVAPGNFISSTVPKAISGGAFVNVTQPLAANPAFEAAANWVTVNMNDDGINGDLQGGDATYTGTIPGQPNRTLIRYRIKVTDNLGNSVTVPYSDDPSLNFGCFVYNGVPDYQGTPSATLQKLPVYHFLTRKADYDQCVAYSASNQLTYAADNGLSWNFENWEAALVFDGIVYDHLRYRVHGGNGRYYFSGKRAFRLFFNRGSELQNRDNDGNPYPTKWNSLLTQNLWENRSTYTFSLNEMVNYRLWNTVGIPAPGANWGLFRTITTAAEQPDAWHGDFWGLILMQEDTDRRFLDAHNLAKGNVYKLSRDGVAGLPQQRYQAPFAVKDGSDHDYIYNNLKGSTPAATVDALVNLDEWTRYHAVAQAVRHYDYWPNGDNNGVYYFEPNYNAANLNHGKLWILPSDVDATWGPTWNNGHDIVHNALFDDSISSGGDSFTNPTLWPRYFNAVREVRDLLFRSDQISPLVDEYAAIIQPLANADFTRWYGAPSDAGNFSGLTGPGMSSSVGQTSLANLVTDMKNFAFVGGNSGNWAAIGGAVTSGGQAAFLDTLQLGVSNSEGSQIPTTPILTYLGAATHPVNDLRFQSSAFGDPQGSPTFAAMQWRIAEITDPSSPAYVPGEKLKLEWIASFDSGELATFTSQYRFPASAAVAGHTYRARVRHKDNTGRWSHWSSPVQFTAAAADVTPLVNSLVVSEVMYHPTAPTPQEVAAGYIEDDFEYIEVRNVSQTNVDLTDVRFTKGINFDFPAGSTLNAGASILVVRNVAAFNSRYGSGKPIAGAYSPDSLKNSGEEIKLSFGAGTPIIDFTYSDSAPWPTDPDTGGYSLVLLSPETRPDPTIPTNWRSSRQPGGSPGSDDRITFASWASANGVSDPSADDDHDGLPNWQEFALGTDPLHGQTTGVPTIAIKPFLVGGITSNYLTLTFTRQIAAEEITYHIEWSSVFSGWSENGVLASSIRNADGSATETWRSAVPISASTQLFSRLRVTTP